MFACRSPSLLGWVALVLVACVAPEPTAPSDAGGRVVAAMPRLRATMLRPIVEAESFLESVGWEYPSHAVKPTPPADAPHETDAAAVAAAVAWIVEHFGPLPPQTTLEPTSVQGTASGSDERRFDWDAGHTIVLHQYYRGMQTDIASVVYIRGRSAFSGHFELASFEPVAGSEAPIVDREAAIDAFVQFARAGGETDDGMIREFRRVADPRLHYVRSNALIGTEAQDLHVPTWGIGTGWWVDAVSGVVWRDC